MTDEIIKYVMIEESNDPGFREGDRTEVIYAHIKLDKNKLKLLKELHVNIGLDEFMQELSDKLKIELKKIDG